MDLIGCWREEEREAVGGVWDEGLEASGVEVLRFWVGAGDGAGPLVGLRAAGALPEMVCLSVSGDGVRGMFLASDGGDLVLSAPRTSFNEIFEPVDATCHGDAELFFCA